MLNFGKTFGVATTAPAFTSFCVNELVAAQIYESNASSESGVCLGVSCYQGSFLIITLTLILTLTLLSRLLSHHNPNPHPNPNPVIKAPFSSWRLSVSSRYSHPLVSTGNN